MRKPPGPTRLVVFALGLQLRRDIEALLRGVNRKAALADASGSCDAERESLERLLAALPSSPRVFAAAAAIAVIVLTQNLLGVLAAFTYSLNIGWLFPGESSQNIQKTLQEFGRTIDVRSASDLVTGLTHADLPQLVNLAAGISLSLIVVGGAYAYAYSRANTLLARPWAVKGTSDRGAAARPEEIGLDARERDLFDALEVARPRDVPVDLVLKAVVCTAPVLLCVYLVRRAIPLVHDQSLATIRAYATPAVCVGLLTGAWVRSISKQWRARRDGHATYLLALGLCLVVGWVTPLFPPYSPVGPTPSDDPLRLTLSSQQNLANIDLRGRNLQGFYLPAKDLRDAQLVRTLLQGAVLASSRLDHANLQAASLEGANLAGADLLSADLMFTTGDHADLSRASLVQANLMSSSWNNANMTGANLRGATITGSASLYGVSAQGADFTAANLSSAGLGGADFEQARLDGANLHNTDLDGTDFRGASLRGCQIDGAALGDTNFTNADLRSASVRGERAYGIRFTGADLRGATVELTARGILGALDVQGADLRGAKLGGLPLIGNSRTRWPTGYVLHRSSGLVYAEATPSGAPRSSTRSPQAKRAGRVGLSPLPVRR
jgi:uncharacterized protein YjbI with pentapeptide repeats